MRTGPGFWRTGPHLVLERRLDYPAEELSVTEYAVVDEVGCATIYRNWEQRFSLEAVEQLVGDAGFELERVAADLTGTPWQPGSESLAVVARRS